jgi:starvation-inducible DNA-binding protein
MLIPKSDDTLDPSALTLSIEDSGTPDETPTLLDELLAHSVHLRDLYKSARWQTADIQFRDLRLVFDDHYKEQLRLVDVLMDRIRMLGGAGRVFAGVFLQGTQFSCALLGRTSPIRLLRDLLDAHELLLSTARSGTKRGAQDDNPSNRDFAVGQVVLANELQSRSLGEQLMRRDTKRRFSETERR